MILSMTGFATSTVEIPLSNTEKMNLSISIKSLNSRFFEMSCKLPSLLSNLEVPMQRILQKQLHRGHVSLHIKIINSESLNEPIKPALQTIQNYLDAIATIRTNFKLQDQVTLAQILQLPHALQSQELDLNELMENSILQAIQELGVKLIETQEKEGLQLAHDIQAQLASMTIKIEQIKILSQQLIKEKKEALTEIMTQLAAIESSSAQDLHGQTIKEVKTTEQCLLEAKRTTLMYEVEKIDINEETVRFNSHLQNVMVQMQSADPIKGKKIDFIVQELNREINTIAAKCSHIGISSLAIDIKAELEKAREQAQNII
ncbi:DUF1732 domain-containing protein [Candidatus Babeliales bacterium]|nr:DUF1732 domain-containing protein [Candidatus Babeliales bacterium]MBP9844243.1 DUF1732 domain-containing protein [Candidatus Babeliales bacterium]